MYNILLVDDEKLIRDGIKSVIPWKKLGIGNVYSACSGEKALEILKKEPVDIVLTDICMARIDGLNLISQINEQYPDIRIIVLTGYSSFEYAKKCCCMKVNDYLLKPVDEDALTASIAKQLNLLDKKKESDKKNKILSRAAGTAIQSQIENKMKRMIYKQDVSIDFINQYQWDMRQQMQIIVILPTVSENKEWEDNYELLFMSVKSICINFFDTKNQGITFEDNDGRIVVAVFTDTTLDSITDRVKSLKDILNDEFNIPLNILIGSKVNGFSEISISYNDAIYLKSAIENKTNRIVSLRKSELITKKFNQLFDDILQDVEDNINNQEYILKKYNEYISSTGIYTITDSVMKKKTFQFISTLYYAYVMEFGEIISSRLNGMATAFQTSSRSEVKKIAEEFIVQLFDVENKHSSEVVYKAKQYINANFTDDLTVTGLAEKFGVASNYFSNLFKKDTGEGCNEYIVQKRIEKAKAILETTNIRIKEIAFLVGYRNINYFSLAFKKKTGVSPAEYRECTRKHSL